MGNPTSLRALEESIAADARLTRRPVVVGFLAEEPADIQKFAGSVPSGCSFWRLAAAGRFFYTVPESHFNCAVGAHTHNLPLSPDRQQETSETLDMMSWLGYVKPEELLLMPSRHARGHRLCPAGGSASDRGLRERRPRRVCAGASRGARNHMSSRPGRTREARF